MGIFFVSVIVPKDVVSKVPKQSVLLPLSAHGHEHRVVFTDFRTFLLLKEGHSLVIPRQTRG